MLEIEKADRITVEVLNDARNAETVLARLNHQEDCAVREIVAISPMKDDSEGRWLHSQWRNSMFKQNIQHTDLVDADVASKLAGYDDALNRWAHDETLRRKYAAIEHDENFAYVERVLRRYGVLVYQAGELWEFHPLMTPDELKIGLTAFEEQATKQNVIGKASAVVLPTTFTQYEKYRTAGLVELLYSDDGQALRDAAIKMKQVELWHQEHPRKPSLWLRRQLDKVFAKMAERGQRG